MRASVYFGEIIAAPAQVVCTSTNPHLDLILGTGGGIREAAGEIIQEECRAAIALVTKQTGRRFLPPGSVVRTTAGRLPFRALLHCVAIDGFHGSSPEVITACVRNALREAAALNPSADSIAMPVFASGNGHFDFEHGLNIMLDEIARPEAPPPETLVIVTRHEDRATLACAILRQRLGDVELLKPSGNPTLPRIMLP